MWGLNLFENLIFLDVFLTFTQKSLKRGVERKIYVCKPFQFFFSYIKEKRKKKSFFYWPCNFKKIVPTAIKLEGEGSKDSTAIKKNLKSFLNKYVVVVVYQHVVVGDWCWRSLGCWDWTKLPGRIYTKDEKPHHWARQEFNPAETWSALQRGCRQPFSTRGKYWSFSQKFTLKRYARPRLSDR